MIWRMNERNDKAGRRAECRIETEKTALGCEWHEILGLGKEMERGQLFLGPGAHARKRVEAELGSKGLQRIPGHGPPDWLMLVQ
jgi:hypothetical protein